LNLSEQDIFDFLQIRSHDLLCFSAIRALDRLKNLPVLRIRSDLLAARRVFTALHIQ
jgi:hypothetical protein